MTAQRWQRLLDAWKRDPPAADYRQRVTVMAFGGRRTHRRLWRGPLVAAITAQVEALSFRRRN